jgi:hypothetical protein
VEAVLLALASPEDWNVVQGKLKRPKILCVLSLRRGTKGRGRCVPKLVASPLEVKDVSIPNLLTPCPQIFGKAFLLN